MAKEATVIETASTKLLSLALTQTNQVLIPSNETMAQLIASDLFAHFRQQYLAEYKTFPAKIQRSMRLYLQNRVKVELDRKDSVIDGLRSVVQDVARLTQASVVVANKMPAINAAMEKQSEQGLTQAVVQDGGKVKAVKAEVLAPKKPKAKPAKAADAVVIDAKPVNLKKARAAAKKVGEKLVKKTAKLAKAQAKPKAKSHAATPPTPAAKP
jgi:hypothetical protein